jgi:hypothetical protein
MAFLEIPWHFRKFHGISGISVRFNGDSENAKNVLDFDNYPLFSTNGLALSVATNTSVFDLFSHIQWKSFNYPAKPHDSIGIVPHCAALCLEMPHDSAGNSS